MSRKNNFVLYEEYACIIRNHYDVKASRYTIFNLAAGVLSYIQLVKPNAVAIAVSVVRMMFTITDHLLFFSFVIMVRDFFSEITIQSEDRT